MLLTEEQKNLLVDKAVELFGEDNTEFVLTNYSLNGLIEEFQIQGVIEKGVE